MARREGSKSVKRQAGSPRRRLVAVGSLGLAAWVSCQVYDPSLLTGPSSSGLEGGVGGVQSGGAGGAGVTGGRGGAAGATAGTSGTAAGASASGGAGAGSAGKGGTGGGSGSAGKGTAGRTGSGGTSGDGGSSGMAGEAGEGGAPDCATLGDCCPDDPEKTDPGVCGCGSPDTDSDLDETPDCDDRCALDPARTEPGVCGCGVEGAEADCAALRDALVHRYSFEGTGTEVEDSKGSLDGTVMGTGAALSGTGTLALAGGVPVANDPNQQYVELGTGCLDGLEDATFEAWLDWSTTCAASGCTNALDWQRVFDFGEAATTSTGSYIFLTPRAARTDNPVLTAGSSAGANNELTSGFRASDVTALDAGSHHFAVVVDDAADQVRLYLDGVEVGSGAYAASASLASLVVTGCFLGRSQYATDPYLNGTFDEFRIYDAALPASALALSHAQGPNPPFL